MLVPVWDEEAARQVIREMSDCVRRQDFAASDFGLTGHVREGRTLPRTDFRVGRSGSLPMFSSSAQGTNPHPLSHVPLACPFRVLDDRQTGAVSTRRGTRSRQLCRLQACVVYHSFRPEASGAARNWSGNRNGRPGNAAGRRKLHHKIDCATFWRLGALRGLLKLGQCLRHVMTLLSTTALPPLFFGDICWLCSRRLICSFKGTTSMSRLRTGIMRSSYLMSVFGGGSRFELGQ